MLVNVNIGDENVIIEDLKKILTPERFEHSIGVMECAIKLALNFGCDQEKALLAGLLHDCAKDFKKQHMLQLCDEFGIVLDAVSKHEKQLIHGPLGAGLAKHKYKINDEEILEAIRYHTVAKGNMTLLTKIIYVADCIEPLRDFMGIAEIRDIAYTDIDLALIKCIDSTIKQVLARGRLIHPLTIEARNYILFSKYI